jgi:hypothetical protein
MAIDISASIARVKVKKILESDDSIIGKEVVVQG